MLSPLPQPQPAASLRALSLCRLAPGLDGMRIENKGHISTLTFFNVSEKDYGNYTCVATNKLGNTNASLTLYGECRKPGCVRGLAARQRLGLGVGVPGTQGNSGDSLAWPVSIHTAQPTTLRYERSPLSFSQHAIQRCLQGN